MRLLYRLLTLVGLALVLVACGNGGDDASPTTPPQPTSAPTDQVAAPTATQETGTPSPTATELVAIMGSPTTAVVTEASATATEAVVASPATTEAVMASPTTEDTAPIVASPVASPAVVASPAIVSTPLASPVAATSATPAPQPLYGTVMLTGVENVDYIQTAEGCVGLGNYRGLQAGSQVVVHDAAGTVQGVTTLQASDETTDCTWTFESVIPSDSEFFSVTLPGVKQTYYETADPELEDQAIEIVLP